MTTRQLARACHAAAHMAEVGKRVSPHTSVRAAGNDARLAAGLRRALSWTTALALMVGIASGAAWLFFLAGRIVGLSPMDALARSVDCTLLTQTQFGAAWQLRAVAPSIKAPSS